MKTYRPRQRRRAGICGLTVGAAIAASCRGTAQVESRCVFPEFAESVITFDYPDVADSSFRGTVVDPGLNPIDGALIMLQPGAVRARTDSTGRFRIEELHRGRFLVDIGREGHWPVSDSVTYSEFGVRVAAILVQQSLDHRPCIRRVSSG
jgi:hypothetical protein